MNHNQFIILLFISVLLSNCTIQKRLYRPGYSIDFKHRIQSLKTVISTEEFRDLTAVEKNSSDPIIIDSSDLSNPRVDSFLVSHSIELLPKIRQQYKKAVGVSGIEMVTYLKSYLKKNRPNSVFKKEKTIEQLKRNLFIWLGIAFLGILFILLAFGPNVFGIAIASELVLAVISLSLSALIVAIVVSQALKKTIRNQKEEKLIKFFLLN